MLGNRHLHSHGHAHAHGLRHRHIQVEPSHAYVDRSFEFVNGGLSGSIADGHAPALLAARSGSDEKPVNPDTTNMIIGISVAVPVVIILCVLVYLHRRNNKRVALEDMDDKYRSLDFGVGDNVPGGGKKRRSAFFGKEKDPASHRVQLSMDMNLSSPYLLPPELQNSRESLHSLTRSLHKSEDPYRLVKEYTSSEVGSMRSFQRGPNRGSSSIYTGKTGSSDRSSGRPTPSLPASRQNSFPAPTSPLPQLPPAAQTPQRQEFEEDVPAPLAPAKNEFRFTDNESPRGVPSLAHSDQVPTIQEPPAAASRISHKAITETVRPMSGESTKADQPYAVGALNDRESMSQRGRQSAAQALDNRDSTRPPRNDSMPIIDASGIQDYQDYSDHFQINKPDHTQPQQTSGPQIAPYSTEDNGPAPAGLGVPAQDNRRLSVGFRPLPPDDFLESEDPEFRANRIRSFYKEYFEDNKQEPARPPMPPMPVPPQNGYYEDYDQNYLGEAAYFDPETNAFVMPYAAPVTRRAMTPPPSNRRPMPGPRQRGPPGGMPMPGRPGGRPRAGSTMSAGRWAPMSPRPGSSASNPRFSNNKPRKPMPPPSDLNTLPTPAKLKDDSFAIFNAMEFAPPPSFKDQARGRSQSPVGERVPYRAGTPVHSPLISAFEETAPLPSPHLLRKSSTFTGLDFAPPRRFKDPEVMSDAGSIRSNRSGLSSQNAIALRNGAGRVSRLPGDTIFTQADSASTLKPQWGMRP